MHDADDIADDFLPAPPDKLYAHYRRQLSAMLDGELSPDEAKFMLRRLQHDSELAACWERWQVCGDVLRGRGHVLLPADFAQRVALAIADEGAVAAGAAPAPGRPRMARWGGRAALAASVAAVAFFVARQLPGDVDPAAADASADRVATAAAPFIPPTDGPVAPASTTDPAFDQAAAVLAVTTSAVAEVPRRAAEQRSRAQSQRAASRVQPRTAAQQAPAMIAASQANTAPATLLAASTLVPASGLADPFATQHDAPSRPWPRAVLPALAPGGSFAASYGSGTVTTPTFHPFEPRLQPRDPAVPVAEREAGAAVAAEPPDAGGADSP